MTPTSNIVSHTLRKNQQHATLQLQNHPSLGPTQIPIGAAQNSFGGAVQPHHMNAPEQMSGSISSTFKESVKPFHIPTTPGGGHPGHLVQQHVPNVVYNHSSAATPMSNISNQLAQHQQHVSQFEVLGGCSGDQNTETSGDTLMNLLAILGRAFALQSKFHCKEAEHIYKQELTTS